MGAAPQQTTVEAAGREDIPDLAGLAAAHTWDTPVGAWLVPEIHDRPGVLMAWYTIVLEQAIEYGYVDIVTNRRWGAAIWLDRTRPHPAQAHHLRRLTTACGRHAITLLRYEHLLEQHQPRTGHLRLLLLAADDPQPASMLLAHRHRILDRTGIPAHTLALSVDQHRVLTAAGYTPISEQTTAGHRAVPPCRLPGGPKIWPLQRPPATNLAEEHHGGIPNASTPARSVL